MITIENFRADINNLDTLGIMIQLKPTETFEGGTALLMPKTFGPTMHLHPLQAELFKVVQGELDVFNGKKWVTLTAGEQLYIPKKTTHSFRNASNEIVVFDFAVTPKIGLTYLLLTLDELVKAGKITNRKSVKSLLYMSQALVSFPAVTKNSWPPNFIVRLLAAVAHQMGLSITREKHRATYLRTTKLWQGPKKAADLTASVLEEMLF